ncbi:MAG: hypothetical protein HYT93_01065 [Parcubacteria group bacterium]|nr:hypothetical protein [Parcubacteria group bacterium]
MPKFESFSSGNKSEKKKKKSKSGGGSPGSGGAGEGLDFLLGLATLGVVGGPPRNKKSRK